MIVRRVRWLAGLLLMSLAAAGCNLPTGAPTSTPTATLAPVLATTAAPSTQPPPQQPTATLLPSPTQAVATPNVATPTLIATATETLPPTVADSGLPATPADVLLSDNFDAPSQQWFAYADESSASGIEGGVYFVSMNATGRWTWRLGPVNSAVKDLVIQADARLANGDPNGVYGFLCRYDSATQSFYNFALTGDGRYRVARVSNGGEWNFLVDFGAPSPIVKPATQWNQVEVGCVGATLWLRVNGVLLATVQDTTFANVGDFGFWAQTRGNATQARAEFDYLTIWATP